MSNGHFGCFRSLGVWHMVTDRLVPVHNGTWQWVAITLHCLLYWWLSSVDVAVFNCSELGQIQRNCPELQPEATRRTWKVSWYRSQCIFKSTRDLSHGLGDITLVPISHWTVPVAFIIVLLFEANQPLEEGDVICHIIVYASCVSPEVMWVRLINPLVSDWASLGNKRAGTC